MTKRIDNKDWKFVSFGEMCKNLNELERDPLANGIDRFVGLEHIERNNLHISSWGNVADGTTFTKRFRKGQVLFGKRRAYLRKAALADFDGICSADILVFEANEKVINPELLPFIVSNDTFFDYATRTSAGSLSPRTKFQDLAKLKFRLPPQGQQARVAELLWAGDSVIGKYQDVLEKAHQGKQRLILNSYSVILNEQYHIIKLIDLVEKKYGIVDGPFGSNLKTIHYRKEGIPIMQSSFVTKGIFAETERLFVDESKYKEQIRSSVRKGDILMAKIGANYGECAIVPPYYERAILAGNSLKITPNNTVCLTEYLLHYLKHLKTSGVFAKLVTTTAQPALSIASLKELKLIIPKDLNKQNEILKKIQQFEKLINRADQSIGIQKEIQKQLINHIF